MNQLTLTPLTEPVTKTVSIPGSKSYTNRALVLAALTPHSVRILNPLYSDDTEAMIGCLKALGIKIHVSEAEVVVEGSVQEVADKEYLLDVNLSGTTARFILALACTVPGTKLIAGGETLNKRPIAELVNGLRQLGAQIDYLEKDSCLPVKVSSSKLIPGIASLNGDISSQYFSALMMISPAVGPMSIEVVGHQISKPYIDMTLDTMRHFGVDMKNENYQRYYLDKSTAYTCSEYTVEGDYSAAGYFFALAALTSSTIQLQNLNPYSSQGDRAFMEIIKGMGNECVFGPNSVTIQGKSVTPLDVNLEPCPDQAQTLAVLVAFAKGTSILRGVRSLRVKETERVIALQNELGKMGIQTESPDPDTLIIHGGTPQPAAIDTYHDHRMAMSFAVAGAKLHGMKINNPEVVTKTFPSYWSVIQSLEIGVDYSNDSI